MNEFNKNFEQCALKRLNKYSNSLQLLSDNKLEKLKDQMGLGY